MRVEETESSPRQECICSARAAICEETGRICEERFGEGLRAVVLSGSLVRNEATFVKEGDRWRLLGDADFFLVFHDAARQPTAPAIESVEREVENVLHGKGLIAPIGLAAVDGSYFRNLPRHIAPYELRACGCVVWGDRDVLSLVPAFAPEQISLEDAWRLLANRMIELLEAVASEDQTGNVLSWDVQYRTAKLYLDMATSYLVFVSRYLPTYREREQELRCLADDASARIDIPFALGPFADRVADCTRFKLEGRSLEHSPVKLCEEAVCHAQRLWAWELKQLTCETSEIPDSELMFRWMARQPVKARIRGWASVLRRYGWRCSWRQLPRWVRLGWRASPRYWLYSVATEIFFRLPSLVRHDGGLESEMDWKPLAGRLPLPGEASSKPSALPWRQLARLTALNYRRFLETTVA